MNPDFVPTPWYQIEATKRGQMHTYERRIYVDRANPTLAFERVQRIAKTAAARGYDVRVYRHENDARGSYRIALELKPLDLPPWGK